ncbi:membrane protein insertase YidC [Archangium violaceum]|uniref:membrane protein insertase YidC n=1 Tax=Archangium violaceum TaxID=83451 RepID=UPI00193B4411|nr:membrane protein insertase YidC [Archangium violaceum]QRK11135.1 membrane protein insertase YidC [Archangium violaceum]
MNDLDPLSPNSADSQRRLLVALALAMGLTFAYTFLLSKNAPPPEAGVADAGQMVAATDAGTPAPTAGGDTGTAGTPPPAGTGTEGAVADAAPPPPVRTLNFERQWAHYTFSTQGAGLTSAVLQGEKMREQQQVSIAEGYKLLFGGKVPPPPQMNLAQPVQGQALPLAISITGPQPLPADARYAVAETDASQGATTFTTRQGPWEVTKSIQWPKEGFELLYTLEVKNVSGQPVTGELQVHYNRAISPDSEHAPSFFGGVGNLSYASCHVGEEKHKLAPDQGQPEPEELRGPVHFFGIDQQYFLSALYPLEGAQQGRCELVATPEARGVVASFPLTAAAGQTVTYRFGGYLGPKDPDLLGAVPGPAVREAAGLTASAYAPQLTETIDYGMWAVIAKLLVTIMKFFHGLVGNWGVAVILLTVLVKTLLLPLTHRSMVSMEAMKKLQPRVDEIRKKYADDRERQNLEMMKVYQENKVNPLGGCLPMLIQMPVWIALFTALRNSYEIYQEPFFGPVWRDLTYKDPTYLLPLALGVSMIITQKLQPQMGDPAQAKIMTWFVPILFTATLLNYPAGLALYIFTNNILSIAQQYGLRKWLEKRGGGSGGLPAGTATATAGGKRK